MNMLEFYRPIKSNWLTQGFGENKVCVKTNADGVVLTPFQYVPIISAPVVCPINTKSIYAYYGLKGHNALDWSAFRREPVFHSAMFRGKIKTEVDRNGGVGVDVVSLEPLLTDASGVKQYIKMRYWHNQHNLPVYDGQIVEPGDLVAYADNTGDSTGDHVHAGPKWCNSKGEAIKTDNGYQGAFNPETTPGCMFKNIFILDQLEIYNRQILTLRQLISKLAFQVEQFLKGR